MTPTPRSASIAAIHASNPGLSPVTQGLRSAANRGEVAPMTETVAVLTMVREDT
jgi:hypothetical protein